MWTFMSADTSRFTPVTCTIWPAWLHRIMASGAIAASAAAVIAYELDAPFWAFVLILAVFTLLRGSLARLEFRPEAVELSAGKLALRGRRGLETPTAAIREIRVHQASFSFLRSVSRRFLERRTRRPAQFPTWVTLALPAASIVLSFEHLDEARDFVRQIRG
jgi:uncharacterized membrane protein YdbT with pleckstrin-like domain